MDLVTLSGQPHKSPSLSILRKLQRALENPSTRKVPLSAPTGRFRPLKFTREILLKLNVHQLRAPLDAPLRNITLNNTQTVNHSNVVEQFRGFL